MVHLKEVQPLTEYVRGGVSPIGTRKKYPVYLDTSVLKWPFISISAGARGCQLFIKPEALARAVGATICPLCRNSDKEK